MKKLLAIVLALVTVACLFTACTAGKNETTTAGADGTTAEAADGKIDAKIILVLEDATEIPYDIKVKDGATVREALVEAKLVGEDAESAFFIEDIDGHVAKAEDGVLWNVCDENGEQLGSVDNVTVSAGKTIKMIYTVAPNFDD